MDMYIHVCYIVLHVHVHVRCTFSLVIWLSKDCVDGGSITSKGLQCGDGQNTD